MSKINRRNFLQTAIAGGALFGFGGLVNRLNLFHSQGKEDFDDKNSLYGALSPKAANNTGETLLALPNGFQYNVIGKAGAPMANGQPTPILHDGMAVFTSGTLPNSWILIRNHENVNFAGSGGAVSGTLPYDSLAAGGVTSLIIDKTTRLITNDFVSLSGTVRNCAGGSTPWRTWISCEETTVGTSNGFAQPHGYCFEVQRLTTSSNAPLVQMGRFKHEAVAFDKTTGIAYLTEDNNPAGFYRFVPNQYGNLAAGGKLQMLAIANQSNYDTRTNQTVGTKLTTVWVDITEPNPVSAESNLSAVFNQGFALGGASFARLEGCFAGLNDIYFTSTNGGNAGLGQVWKYEARKKSNFGHLTLIFESPSADVLDFPDNICFGANGNLFICEDGSVDNYVKILSPNGALSQFAKNIVPGFESFEMTGGAFSPDLQTFFVNAQTPGLTFAIWGNW
jgi:uncharacterized protein